MADLGALKRELGEAMHDFAKSEDIQDPKTLAFINEGGVERASFRRKFDFIATENRISQALSALEEGNIEPIIAISEELAQIGVRLELNSEGADYEEGDAIAELILVYRGNIRDRCIGFDT